MPVPDPNPAHSGKLTIPNIGQHIRRVQIDVAVSHSFVPVGAGALQKAVPVFRGNAETGQRIGRGPNGASEIGAAV